MFIAKIKNTLRLHVYLCVGFFKYHAMLHRRTPVLGVNIGGGTSHIDGFVNVDMNSQADIVMDLEKRLLPFADSNVSYVVCISAINYFSRDRGAKIIKDVYRILKPGGIARFATQDLFEISRRYVHGEKEFFFEKLPNGKDRFRGATMADKINEWFYGYKTVGNKPSRYFYDFESLSLLFKEAGFATIERKQYLDSKVPNIEQLDNRPEQMFFLEAQK